MEVNPINIPKEMPVAKNEAKVSVSKKENFDNALNEVLKDEGNSSKKESSLIENVDSGEVDLEKLKDYLKDLDDTKLSESEKNLLMYLVQNLSNPLKSNETKLEEKSPEINQSDETNKVGTQKSMESYKTIREIINILQESNSDENTNSSAKNEKSSINEILLNPKIKGIIIDDGRFSKLETSPTINNGNLSAKDGFMDEMVQKKGVLDTKESTKNSTNVEEAIKSLLKEKIDTSLATDVDNTGLRNLEMVSSIRNLTNKSKEINSTQIATNPDLEENLQTISSKDLLKSLKPISEQNSSKNTLKTTDINKDETNLIQDSKLNSKEDKILKGFIKEEDSNIPKVNSQPFKLAYGENAISVNKVETPVINKSTLVNDIIKSVKYMDNEGIKNLTVKISPKDLGEVIIKISMEQGNIKATINATSKEGYNLLSQNFSELNQKIVDSNLKIQSFDLGQYQNGASLFNEGGNKENSNKGNKSKKDSIMSIDIDEEIKDNEKITDNLNIFV